ncbi:MAG: lamin tail domain-containing protein [Acidimicrobiia bacterium]
MLKTLTALVFLAAACGSAPPADADPTAPEERSGAVVAVLDGDSVRVAVDGVTTEVRLLGINAPEIDECWANEARSALQNLLEEEITLVEDGADQFGRTLAHLYSGGRHINLALVEEGAAIALATAQPAFASAEQAAFEDRVGLWSPTACGPETPLEVFIEHVSFDAPGPDDEYPNGEFVVVSNEGPDADLGGWWIRDESSTHRFRFPDGFVLVAGGLVIIRSGCGQDGDSDLYWCANGPVWNNDGDMVLLLDTYGNVVDRWRYAG